MVLNYLATNWLWLVARNLAEYIRLTLSIYYGFSTANLQFTNIPLITVINQTCQFINIISSKVDLYDFLKGILHLYMYIDVCQLYLFLCDCQ